MHLLLGLKAISRVVVVDILEVFEFSYFCIHLLDMIATDGNRFEEAQIAYFFGQMRDVLSKKIQMIAFYKEGKGFGRRHQATRKTVTQANFFQIKHRHGKIFFFDKGKLLKELLLLFQKLLKGFCIIKRGPCGTSQ